MGVPELLSPPSSGDLTFASGCALAVGGSVIFGANAICRYFSYKGTPPSPRGANVDPSAVDGWVEWEAGTLSPVERMLASAKEANGATPAETLAALKHLDETLTGDWLVEGVRRPYAEGQHALCAAVVGCVRGLWCAAHCGSFLKHRRVYIGKIVRGHTCFGDKFESLHMGCCCAAWRDGRSCPGMASLPFAFCFCACFYLAPLLQRFCIAPLLSGMNADAPMDGFGIPRRIHLPWLM